MVSGYSAAALLGASCGPRGAPAELTVPGGGPRSHPGLLLHRDRLARDEVQQCNGVLVTTPVRTAYDLARWQEPVEAVVAVDALANRGRFAPEQILCHGPNQPILLLISAAAAQSGVVISDRRSASTR